MTSHGIQCGSPFLSWYSASSSSAFGRQIRTWQRASSRRALGTIGQCEHRGRGNENYCHYTFPVGDEQYTGVNRAAPEVDFGQTVVVYYDVQDPRVNALEDFAEQSRKNKRFVYILLLVLVAIVAFILWDRAPYRETSGELTP